MDNPKRIAELEAKIAELEAKINKKDCIADLRRKQKREKNWQIEQMKRGVNLAYKAMYGER